MEQTRQQSIRSLGIDIGSTTVKIALMEGDRVLYERYERHYSQARQKILEMLSDLEGIVGDTPLRAAISGSAGIGLAEAANLPFQQEVFVVGELVRAILQDEPMKMRRLADIFHIDIASINSMWIISGDTAEDREKLADVLEPVLRDTRACSEAAIADIYEGEMVLFMIGPGNIQDVRALTEAIGNGLVGRGIRATLTRCHALNTTTRVREAFLSHQVALPAAKRIFPGQWAYMLEQIDFARQCQELIGRGERAVQEALRCVAALQDGDSLLETLECYLLDARMHVTLTAEKMFLHKNTIKYRLQRIADRLGFVPGELPESMPLFTACALDRLLRGN